MIFLYRYIKKVPGKKFMRGTTQGEGKSLCLLHREREKVYAWFMSFYEALNSHYIQKVGQGGDVLHTAAQETSAKDTEKHVIVEQKNDSIE